jgi:hypothetical protein
MQTGSRRKSTGGRTTCNFVWTANGHRGATLRAALPCLSLFRSHPTHPDSRPVRGGEDARGTEHSRMWGRQTVFNFAV